MLYKIVINGSVVTIFQIIQIDFLLITTAAYLIKLMNTKKCLLVRHHDSLLFDVHVSNKINKQIWEQGYGHLMMLTRYELTPKMKNFLGKSFLLYFNWRRVLDKKKIKNRIREWTCRKNSIQCTCYINHRNDVNSSSRIKNKTILKRNQTRVSIKYCFIISSIYFQIDLISGFYLLDIEILYEKIDR